MLQMRDMKLKVSPFLSYIFNLEFNRLNLVLMLTAETPMVQRADSFWPAMDFYGIQWWI